LLVATLLTAIGLALLGRAEAVTWWEFAVLVSSGWAAFVAAIGVMLGKTAKRTAYGAGVGIAITIWAIVD
jgi:hypothetical protein